MIWYLVTFFWTSSTVIGSSDISARSKVNNSIEFNREIKSRGYHGGFGYPYLPFLEPLSILAVLGFLAFLIQTLHSMYQNHNTGLVGGLLNNVLPGTHKNLPSANRRHERILTAIEFYEGLNKSSEKNKNFEQDDSQVIYAAKNYNLMT